MLKSGAWLLTPLLLYPPGGLIAQVLPETDEIPLVDTITPVPAPEIPFGDFGATELEMPKELKMESGGMEGDVETGVRFKGPIRIEGDNGLEIFANRASLDLKAEAVTLEGDVTIYQGNLMQRGERAVYYYERKFLDTSGLRASVDPILLEAGKFTAEQQGDRTVFIGQDAAITTHDVEDPNYWVRAKETRIYPGEKVVFKDLRLYAGDTPVFWLPYLSQPLDAELGYHFMPGGRSSWGPFLLNTYGIMLGGEKDPVTGDNHDAWLLSRWNLDILTKRGLGLGVDLADTRTENLDEFSGFSFYYLQDRDPEYSRSGVPRGDVNPDRYQIELKHRIAPDFHGEADWRFDSNLTYLSDQYYLEDFEPSLYRTDPAPDNTLGVYRRTDGSLLSFLLRYQLNDFYRADTRLPEVTFDMARAPLFGLPLLHEGSVSMGLIGEEAADPTRGAIIAPLSDLTLADAATRPLLNQLSGYERRLAEEMVGLPLGSTRRDAIRTQLLDSGYARFRAYEELSLPMLFGGFLSFTPQAGAGYTRYGAIEGPLGGFDRSLLHIGAETSLKFAKELNTYQNSEWGLDGVMHVFQPYGAWSLTSTNDFEAGDPAVDRLTPTTRPRPLDPLRFTATDEMESWNVVRLGARNRLLTKRDGQSFEWLYLDTYIDLHRGSRRQPRILEFLQRRPLAASAVAGRRSGNPVSDRQRWFGFSEMNYARGSISCRPTTSSFRSATAGSTATRCCWIPTASISKPTPGSPKTGASAPATCSNWMTARSNSSNTPSTATSETGLPGWA
jgi:LPS-assembly protein